MASGVFGIPISVETVRATGEYTEPITQYDAADYAMKMINAGGKDINAQKFVDDLKARYGSGISTKCLIYNATGTTLRFVAYNDWHGHIYDTPYPSDIQNGQWGAFLHVKTSGAATGSAGAVVYRNDPGVGSSCDWLFSWSIPYFGGSDRVYTQVGETGTLSQNWDNFYQNLENSSYNYSHDKYGYTSRTDIGEGTTVNARAVFQFPYKSPNSNL